MEEKLPKPLITKFLMLGLYNAGKTSFIRRLKNGGRPKCHSATIGAEIYLLDQDGIALQAWDHTGRVNVRGLSRMLYRGTSGIIFMIDSADTNRFDESLYYLNSILLDEEVDNITIMVVANKQDLNDAVGPEVIEEKIKQTCEIGQGITLFVMPMSVTAEDDHGMQLAYRLFSKTMRRSEKEKTPGGLIPRAWETAEKEAENSEIDDDDEGRRAEQEDKSEEKEEQPTYTDDELKTSFFKDAVHFLKSLLIY